MIKQARFQNILSHKDSTLNFHKGVNVLVGESRHGKSALLYGLNLVATNKPGGTDHISYWKGTMNTSITTDEGHVVERIRNISKKINKYVLNGDDFKAIGTNVPQEVQDVLKMDSINIMKQFDKSFLLHDTPGAVASHFNKIAGLDVIDRVTSNIKSEITSLKQQQKTKEKLIKENEESLIKYADLSEMDLDITAIEIKEKMLSTKSKQLKQMKQTLLELEENEKVIYTNNVLLNLKEKVDLVFSLEKKKLATNQKRNLKIDLVDQIEFAEYEIGIADKITALKEKVNEIAEIQANVSDLKQKIEAKKNLLAQINLNVSKTVANEKTIKLDTYVKKIFLLREKASVLSEKIANKEKVCMHIGTLEKKINALEKTQKEDKKVFHKEMPDECPLCNTERKKKNA